MEGNGFPGLFIVIEGPDASGKETQTGRIVEWLREEDLSEISPKKEQDLVDRMPGSYPSGDGKVKDSIRGGVWRLSFPTYHQTPGGRVVGAYLDGDLGERGEIDIETIVDIYAADRKQFKEQIREYLENGGIIVCDRYREANLIHQLVGFQGENWNRKLDYIKSVDADLPDADRILYLDITPEEAIRRMSDKDKDIHEVDDSYMKKSNRNGKRVAEHEGWKIIDAEREIEKVEESIRQEIGRIIR